MNIETQDLSKKIVSANLLSMKAPEARFQELQPMNNMEELLKLWNFSSLESEEYLAAEEKMKEIIVKLL